MVDDRDNFEAAAAHTVVAGEGKCCGGGGGGIQEREIRTAGKPWHQCLESGREQRNPQGLQSGKHRGRSQGSQSGCRTRVSGGGQKPRVEGPQQGDKTCGVSPNGNKVPGGYGRGQGGDINSPTTQVTAADNGCTIEGSNTSKYGTQNSVVRRHDPENGSSEENGGERRLGSRGADSHDIGGHRRRQA